eukprot:COSAG01_NODE_13389_length_1593_cov_1.113788_1_plen_117_part_10
MGQLPPAELLLFCSTARRSKRPILSSPWQQCEHSAQQCAVLKSRSTADDCVSPTIELLSGEDSTILEIHIEIRSSQPPIAASHTGQRHIEYDASSLPAAHGCWLAVLAAAAACSLPR